MERMTLAETIKEITRKHLEEDNGLLFGQCVTAVGWINGSVPDCKNIVELPMTDVAAAGFAVGAALVGRRPIFVLRFQDFFTLNCNQIVHYAAMSKELHNQGVPIFVRCIGMDGVGPVHSIVLHNIAMYFPGMLVCSPMTPGEYRKTWDFFMKHDRPLFVSEHRRMYQNTEVWDNTVVDGADITLYAISDARMEMVAAAAMLEKDGIVANVMHIVNLKPFDVCMMGQPLLQTQRGLVIDNGFPDCGAARSIAYVLAENTGHFVHAMSSRDAVKCFNPEQQNRTPSAGEIYKKVLHIVKNV
jgi:pyruvate dehydrogenase E1 component beta subunit